MLSDAISVVMMKEELSKCLIFLLLLGFGVAQHHLMSPFFFMCNYHTESDLSTLNTGEVAISVSIKDNPEYYIPSELYEVSITSSRDFDGFLLTGLYTIPSDFSRFPMNSLPGLAINSGKPFGQNFMCSHVHSHISHRPKHQLSFTWKAPAQGTGCVSFVATATLGPQILFKDTTVMQLCEEGGSGAVPPRPTLTTTYSDGVILREDFDSGSDFSPQIWNNHRGFELGISCGTVLHGKSAVACNATGDRHLITHPFNLTSASVVQFAIASGSCEPAKDGEQIIFSYGKDGCVNFTDVTTIMSPTREQMTIHLVHLPVGARRDGVCLRWEERTNTLSPKYTGCWAVDNVVITNLAEPSTMLQEDFDPIDPANWLFLPGANIRHKCHSDNHALVFESEDAEYNFVTSRDMNLKTFEKASSILYNEMNDASDIKEWVFEGGHIGHDCGTMDLGDYAVMSGGSKRRRLCTPLVNLEDAGALQFFFTFGNKACTTVVDWKSEVFLYIEDAEGYSIQLIDLAIEGNEMSSLVSVPIPLKGRGPKQRVCWNQKQHSGQALDAWAVDMVSILPLLPEDPQHFLQFSLNMKYGPNGNNSSAVLEFSTDHGKHWFPMYEQCIEGTCNGTQSVQTSTYSGDSQDGWTRYTLPVPKVALTKYSRFRWRQLNDGKSKWALDSVFIGHCPNGCMGHGKCTENGCQCDFGYEGFQCDTATGPVYDHLIDLMTDPDTIHSNFDIVKGANLGYSCGLVSSGKAAVFNLGGLRQLETRDLNTTNARYLQFSIRVGSESAVGGCPPPDQPENSIFLQYSCNGGISWSLMKTLTPEEFSDPMVVSIHLPPSAQKNLCRFRWNQPFHSGPGQDVWAIDDVSVTSEMYNTILEDFSDPEEASHSLDVHLGSIEMYCGRMHPMSFTDPYQEGEYRYLMTSSMLIGPSYILQFELVMGCSFHFLPDLDNSVYLEYSVDHGMTWDLVRRGCWPPRMCENYHMPTIFHASQFLQWKRVTIILPSPTWSSITRLRFRQSRWTGSDSWAIGSLYVGQQCPNMCHGHGKCQQGACICDTNFAGPSCEPNITLPDGMKNDFSLISQLEKDWQSLYGGEPAGANQGCGTILSGESLFFFKDGPRVLMSKDLNTTKAQFLSFYAQLGGINDIQCFGIDRRQENVLVQYSTDGGISWKLLKELQGNDFRKPSLAHINLPEESQTQLTRFRWWQPTHSGQNTDQWSIDQVILGKYDNMPKIEDNFELLDEPADEASQHRWLTITEAMYAPYCGSQNDALMFANQNNDKFAQTTDMILKKGDIIQFRINVGCSKSFSFDYPVLFQFSKDAGMSWNLVEESCYLDHQCPDKYNEGSIYHAGTYGEWRLVLIPVSPQLLSGKVNFRWWQSGGSDSSFALDDVYIGSPCPDVCSGHGVCRDGSMCHCQRGYGGDNCEPLADQPYGMVERFENSNRPGELWEHALGGKLGNGCGVISNGNSIYFDGEGTREARTVPLDVKSIRVLQFHIKIGSRKDLKGCRRPVNRNEGVVVDYSKDNGVTWHMLKTLDPKSLEDDPHSVTIEIPPEAKSASTVFRWWQPLGKPDKPRAEWALDDVIIAGNDTSYNGFQENFNPMKKDIWFMAMNAVPKITCHSRDNALEFSKNGNMRYAETWDYEVTPSSFLQFDISMGCSGTYSTLYGVMLEFSVDMGRTWHPVAEECLPPQSDCSGYHVSSNFMSDSHANWTRVTLYLPSNAVSPATRFRWLQQTVSLRGNVWALDNIYLGDGCPWMCSGHGHCSHGVCMCDPGYAGEYCVPAIQLPTTLRDDFDMGITPNDWPVMHGGEPSNICGLLVTGKALTFYKDNLRMAVTRDMDVSMSLFLQFTFQYGCNTVRDTSTWPSEHMVLLQYSVNGGILWHLLDEIHYESDGTPRYFTHPLPSQAQINSTRFRFWQPKHGGLMKSVWSIDNFYIGGDLMNPDMLQETFNSGPHPDDWLFWPGGTTAEYCSFSTRNGELLTGTPSLVFSSGPGERSVSTRDLAISDMSIIQFDINIGCTPQPSHINPVRLEYSYNQGKSWQLVVPPCTKDSLPNCADRRIDSTIYYQGTTEYWRRVVVPLSELQLCGDVRFRWYQGFYPSQKELAVEWAIDNVLVGMQCEAHCNGHGTCINGMFCQCDTGYDRELCVANRKNPNFLLESFDDSDMKPLNESKWWLNSGGVKNQECGTLVSDNGLVFTNTGVRALITQDLDLNLASVIQFFIKLGCGVRGPNNHTSPVMLQYSTNGGILWHTLQQFDFAVPDYGRAFYVAMPVPYEVQTNATRIRWWQPTENGTFLDTWAVDQIYIGGNINGRMVLQDNLSDPSLDNWLLYPGAMIQPACGVETKSLNFAGDDPVRYVVSNDVSVTEATYLQFTLAMGCEPSGRCYAIELQYALDLGKTWNLVWDECLPSDVECSQFHRKSQYTSDVYHGWNRITVELPYYTRSKATRFRWIQRPGFYSENTWAIKDVYIGDECKCSCAGHGRCDQGMCICDKHWSGDSCSEPDSTLQTLLTDSFTQVPTKQDWISINGGSISTECGVLASGPSIHFKGGCIRQLITIDLDLRQAVFIQFVIKFGCLSPPTHRDEGVIVDYSTNGGKTWNLLKELYYVHYRRPSSVSLGLPKDAKKNGVRVRWWQPKHGGPAKSDWAVDNVVIGGNDINPIEVKDGFHGNDSERRYVWLQQDNVKFGRYCGSSYTVTGQLKEDENVTLMSSDLTIEPGYILQFSISVGCNSSSDKYVAPVHLQYSNDYGMNWHHLVDQCLPFIPMCHDNATIPSVYYPNVGWRRITIPLDGTVVSNGTRFRWVQWLPEDPSASGRQSWALDDVYIGPACADLCGGHGHCDHPVCICDRGYRGENCYQVRSTMTDLKDTFENKTVDPRRWSMIQGSGVGLGCSALMEAPGLHFDGPGQRQAVTVDLDLRNARFIQYYAMIGGPSEQKGCGVPASRNESVFLQYSTDGGITWLNLHVLDHNNYWAEPLHEYIPLPAAARTNSTRVRWWQPLPPGWEEGSYPLSDMPHSWSLDDVYIGGAEINPSDVLETFEEEMDDIEFYPSGHLETNMCGKQDHVLAWKDDSGMKMVTTRQMIVQEHYMIQFKITVGCGDTKYACDTRHAILLQFNKDPSSEDWHVIHPQCLINDHENNMECRPYKYQQGSIYTASTHREWRRATLLLPPKVYSGQTRFRWFQDDTALNEGPGWAIDDIYIGEECPGLCNGRGDCVNGLCECDPGYLGDTCKPVRSELPSHMTDGFEGGVSTGLWETVEGGGLGMGCGSLLPLAHGKNLYFNGCGIRQAVTTEMDVTRASKVMFVLQIGSNRQVPTCNVNLKAGSGRAVVVLEYTKNKGIDWNLIATHEPSEFLLPKRVAYEIPPAARTYGIQFRWWQPEHGGARTDQWAIDYIEIIMTRQDKGLRDVQSSLQRNLKKGK